MPKANSQQPTAGTTTWHLHLTGQVQGVGFRPFVYLLARDHGLHGWVNNTVDGVHIEVNAAETEARAFLKDLIEKAPRLSRITGHSLVPAAPQVFSGFNIIQSHAGGDANLLLTPDFAICEDCRRELHDPGNRRHAYPFITCTNCGPRFSIAHTLPYDRETTTMAKFTMCPVCEAEYNNPNDRRYFSQTNSCPVCPVELSLFSNDGALVSQNPAEIIATVVRCWEEGKIVAIKGIGGYLLTCDASNNLAVETLRQRKHRPSKPFALMFPDVETLRQAVRLRPEEEELLLGAVSPVVLVKGRVLASVSPPLPPLKGGMDPENLQLSSFAAPQPPWRGGRGGETPLSLHIAPGLPHLGVMLPYTPLYEQLLAAFGKPIVATSGNRSNSPIVFEDENAVDELGSIAGFLLTNNRDITVPQDDSVVKFTGMHRRRIVLRRSRGMAPTFINNALDGHEGSVLAAGAMLKSTFALLHQGNIYLSQYLGDLESFDTEENYRHTVRHFIKLLGAKPGAVVVDKHPQYPSTLFGQAMAGAWGVSVKMVQHHLAHFAAVLGENRLLHSKLPVLGVVWDGTGYGDDGQVWGGEFFIFENSHFRRCRHFDYFNFILGDKMPREPRISALSACHGLSGAADILRQKFNDTEWRLYTAMLDRGSPLRTSSVGRIFDGVASLLGILDVQTYEGEAAMLLETLAEQYVRQHGADFTQNYFTEKNLGDGVPTPVLFSGILADLVAGRSAGFIAARFHCSLAVLIKMIARQQGLRRIAFSGGVFQNGLLVDLILSHLGGLHYELFFHEELSPNDENIAFGQLVLHRLGFEKVMR